MMVFGMDGFLDKDQFIVACEAIQNGWEPKEEELCGVEWKQILTKASTSGTTGDVTESIFTEFVYSKCEECGPEWIAAAWDMFDSDVDLKINEDEFMNGCLAVNRDGWEPPEPPVVDEIKEIFDMI